MTWPNPYDDPDAYRLLYLGGWLVPALVVAVDGVEIKQKWTVQQAKDKSGATAVWNGTDLVESLVYTLEAPRRELFASLEAVYRKLAPPAGGSTAGGPGATTPTGFNSGNQSAGGTAAATPAATASTPSATPTGFSSGGAPSAADTAAKAGAAGAPKPPSVTIRNAFANNIGVVAVGMKTWKGPYVTKGISWRVDLGVIQVKASTKVNGGPANPASPTGFDSGTPKDAADKAGSDAKAKAEAT